MSYNKWKKEICTIPNLLSLFRIALIPVYMNLYLHAEEDSDYLLAGSILALSCLTDLADGKIAREFHMVSQIVPAGNHAALCPSGKGAFRSAVCRETLHRHALYQSDRTGTLSTTECFFRIYTDFPGYSPAFLLFLQLFLGILWKKHQTDRSGR